MRHPRLLKASFALIILALVISFATAGTLEPKTVQEVNGLDRILSIRGLQLGPALWIDELRNESCWRIVNSEYASGALTADGSIKLEARFTQGMNSQEIELYRNVNLSLDESPSLFLDIEASKGLGYGLGFYGLFPNGTSFSTWNDGSYLQNRTGLGSPESISANLRYETFLAIGNQPPANSRIIRISFYMDDIGLNESGEFSLSISRIAAYGFILSYHEWSDKAITGNFLDIVIDLRQPDDAMSFYQAYAGFDIRGSANLEYVGYLTQGYSILAQSFDYRTKSITPYELMLLSPAQNLVSGAPPNYLDANSYSVILSAQRGFITYFHLDSLALRYAAFNSTGINPSDLPFVQGLFLLYIALVFQVPIGVVIVLYDLRKVEK
jgi:hypothetical protein